MKSIVYTVLLFFTFTFFSGVIFSRGIDLAELQKKEAKRRKKTPKSKYILTDSSILTIKAGNKKVTFIKTDEHGEEKAKDKKLKKKREQPNPKETRKYWQRRMKSSNDTILRLKEEITKTKLAINREQTNYLTLSIPSQINNAKTRLDSLSRKLKYLKQKLSQAEIERENIFEDARKSNVPPGWLR